MSREPAERPYGDLEPERLAGAPHIADYWQVITRRLWLVLIIFTVTTASAIWAVSRQRVTYRGSMSLQVNDPLERQRGLVVGPRVSGMDIFVDPIESEIQVLRSSTIAESVVDSVGLRLMATDDERVRSSLFRDAHVADAAPSGSYTLAYDDGGTRAELRDASGTPLASARVGTRLDAGFASFVVQPPPGEDRSYDVAIVPLESVLGEIRFVATPRENTNIIDVSFVHPDPFVVPRVLNAAGRALREKGAERVRQSAQADIDFINEQLADQEAKLQQSMAAIRDFKETRAFTNLSQREQQLLNRSEDIGDDIASWSQRRTVLAGLISTIRSEGIEAVDLNSVRARLSEQSPEVRAKIAQIVDRQAEERQLRIEERKSAGHPQVVAVRAEIDALGEELVDAARGSLQVVEERLEELTAQQADLRAEQARFPELQSELQALEAQQSLDQQSYQFLLSQSYQARITQAAASPYVEILDPARGAVPVDSRSRVNVFLGALLGLILGVGAAFFLEYLDRTVRTSADVESLLGIPVLGVIPRLRRIEDALQDADELSGRGLPLVVAMDPLDPAAEAYRNLRMNLMFMSTDDEPIRTVLFSSPGPSEGKSTTGVNFAVMLARQGQRVLLVDADLRRPSLHRALDVLREPGLSNLIIGDAEAHEAVRPNVLPNLDFLPSGPFPPNPSELLNSRTTQRVLEDLRERYDMVIIDSPPVLAVTDASILAANTDGVVLVLRSGETEQRTAERSVDQLRRLGARVFGAVLNEVSAASPDESYYLQYYYSYHPTEGGSWQRLREGLGRVKFFG